MMMSRKGYLFVRSLTIIFALFLFGSQIKASAGETANSIRYITCVQGEVLVKFRSGTTDASIRSVLSRRGAVALDSLYDSREKKDLMSKVKIREGLDVIEAVSQFRLDPAVEHVQPNFKYRFFSSPDDPLYPELWGLDNTGQEVLDITGAQDSDIDAPEAWDIATGSSDIVIAVVDSGVAYSHPDLENNIWVNPGEIADDGLDNDGNDYVDDIHGWDFFDNDNDPMDDDPAGHGTFVAGIIGAHGNNGVGTSGLNWNGSIMALKIGGSGGFGTTFAIVGAINYAAENSALVINASWGGYALDDQLLYDAIETAGDAGILFVASTGNAGSNNDEIPSYPDGFDLPNIISVAATDQNDGLATTNVAGATFSSNYGAISVDVAAPGVNILSTTIDGYGYMEGTSAAAPFVTGLAGLILSLDPDLAVDELKGLILDGVDTKPGLAGMMVTGGRVNAFNSLSLMLPAIGYAPTGLNFIAIEGGANPDPQALSIWNSRHGLLSWSVSHDAAWLSTDPVSGSSTGETGNVTISASAIGLAAGSYDAGITISVTGATSTSEMVPVSLTVTSSATPSDHDDGGSCFIATAAYGSYLHHNVKILRQFRDEWLLTNSIGSALVSFYYTNSPPVSEIIRRHESLRAAVRLVLTPLVYGVKYRSTLLLFSCLLVAGYVIRQISLGPGKK